ncbi:hypothetical protein DQ354_08425 [Arthrobacter sp. AQ5-06]|nr:hypothetical protein DQ354_08425 [Arthrobacter sp. AQ5-06]
MRHDWIHKAIPGVRVARGYKVFWLRSDLAAGAALSAALIPAGMAYTEAAGLPAAGQDPAHAVALAGWLSILIGVFPDCRCIRRCGRRPQSDR